MKLTLNPNKIFEEYAIISNKKQNPIHFIDEDLSLIYEANQNTLPYYDHIETSNQFSSLILSYGGDENGMFYHTYHVVFPTFRKKVNDTRGSFSINVVDPITFIVNHQEVKDEILKRICINKMIQIETLLNDILIQRCFICGDTPSCITKIELTNLKEEEQVITLKTFTEDFNVSKNDVFDRPYYVHVSLIQKDIEEKNVTLLLKPHQKKTIYLCIACDYIHEFTICNPSLCFINKEKEVESFLNTYKVTCNYPTIDAMAKLSKIRTFESIFKTKNGWMHSPGGGQYYAAIWCNDQCEYAMPFFSYNNIDKANFATYNCFKMFQKYMFTSTPLVSSIIAEGIDYWNGAKDRGDAAMYLYGVTQYLLIQGDKKLAKEFIDAIQWCIDYSFSKMNSFGVIDSDADELENRFESGNCNLATNSIFYQGLINASALFDELKIQNDYFTKAETLKENINQYFYKDGKCLYCKEETHLRAHVVYPLIMDIYEHVDDIIKVLLHPSIYTHNGFKIIDNCDTYWDRITLMAIRGLFNADKADLAFDILFKYCEQRMLYHHVPYAIEAYPEGNQAHLSAESALFERIFLEGILGFKPLSFTTFKLHLSIPQKLRTFSIENITYNHINFDILITRLKNNEYEVKIPKLSFKVLTKNFKDVLIQL